MVSPEPDEEYLDDPIQLIDFEQKRIAAAVNNYNSLNAEPAFELIDSECDLYIEKNNKVPERRKSVSITLPLTFFEKPRNVEQLNRCKPLSIKVVNCMEHPGYYKKYLKNRVNNSADKEVEFFSKKNGKVSKKDNDDMINEERKIKIRPVTSPYGNLKVDSSKDTILERRESKSSECRNSKEIIQNRLNQKDDLQVDFKKNQGLIGMKITQTHETPSKAEQRDINGTKLKKQKTKATPKVNISKNKTASVTSKTENISKKGTFVTTSKELNKVDGKCATDIEKNNTVGDPEIKDFNGQLGQNSVKTEDKWKSVIGTKVHGIIDKTISNNTDLASKFNSVEISKVREAKKNIQNNSKSVGKLSVVNEKNCNPKKVPLAESQLVTNRDDSCASNVQSVFFTESHNVQKQTSTPNQAKQESNKPNPKDLVEVKVVRKDKNKTAYKISNDVNVNKTNDFTKYHNVIQNNKTIANVEQNSSNVKETPKQMCQNYAETKGNGNLNTGHKKTTSKKNSILNMKLFKPKKSTSKIDKFCKITQPKSQKMNCLSNNAARVNLIKEQTNNVKQLVSKNLNPKKNTGPGNYANVKLPNETVKTPSLVNNDSRSDTLAQKINHQINPSVVHMGKLTDTNQHLTPTDNNNSSQPSAFYVDKFVKIMGQSSQQPSNQVTETQLARKQEIFQTHSSLENVHSNNNTVVKKVMIPINVNEQIPVKKTSNNNSINKVMPNNPSNLDILSQLNNNNISVKQQLSKNMNLNTSVTHTSAPNAIQINHSGFATDNFNQPGIQTQVTRDTHLVKNLPQASTCNNIVTQPHIHIPLNIPPELKRYPRVIKISKRYPEAVKSHMQNNNALSSTDSRLPTAVNPVSQKVNLKQNEILDQHNMTNQNTAVNLGSQKVNLKQYEILDQHNMTNQNISRNNSNTIPSGQTYPCANNNQIQGRHYLPTYEITRENFLKQYPSAFQQNQGATNSQMFPQFYPAAQQVLRHPPFNQSMMSSQQNVHSKTGVNLFSQPSPKQTLPQMASNNMPGQAGNHALIADQLYKTTPGILPPTCDIQQTVPRHDLNAQNTEFQPQQHMSLKTSIPRILLRKPITKKVITRPNLHTIVPRHDAPQHLYPANFRFNSQPSMQLYGQGIQQAYSGFSQVPPQNYVHCAPNYGGLPSNMNSVNSVPNENYWGNYYPMTLPPPPPPPLYPDPVQLVTPSISQTSALYNQTNCVTSTPKSIAGTTIIGCNNTGPVRKINIMTEPSDVLSSKPNNTLLERFEIDQSGEINRKCVTNMRNSIAQIQLTETTIDESKKKTLAGEENVKHIKGMLDDNQTVNSKIEMLEELSKLTTIESAKLSPVKELKRDLPKLDAKREEANLIKRPLPEPDAKQDEANLINRPLVKPGVKQEEANLLKTPLPKPVAKPDEANLINRHLLKPGAKQEEASLLKTPSPKSAAKEKAANLLKRPMPKPDPIQEEANFIKMSKPGPLSKKLKLMAAAQSKAQTCTVAHKGYSPPILPIPTYQKSLEILALANIADSNFPFSTKKETGTEPSNTTRYSCDEKQEKLAKKISLDEYKKRSQGEVTDGDLHVSKIKIEIKSVNSEQDLGYDSDSTMKS